MQPIASPSGLEPWLDAAAQTAGIVGVIFGSKRVTSEKERSDDAHTCEVRG